MRNRENGKLIFAVSCLLSVVLLFPSFSSAKDLSVACELENIESRCEGLAASDCRKILEECEQYYTDQSEEIQKDITKTSAEKKTLQNKINGLNSQIKNLSYQISQSNLIIKDLRIQIKDTESSIDKTSSKIEDSRVKLANIIRSIYQEDQKPIVEILFAEDDLSGFFDNMVALEVLNEKSKELLQNIKILKSNLEDQKLSLDQEKGDLEHVVQIQTVQKDQSSQTKKEQEYYLDITEQEYQKQLAEKETIDQKAGEIRARIFELIGVPNAPTFGEAYEIAKYVESITGVRPAFLLAILTQESSIGKNVGQCYLKNPDTGSGEIIRTGAKISKVMSPKRDVNPFLTITKEVYRDPYMTPVSCPMSYGWGGAMGPAQFIPSTWMIYRDKIAQITGEPGDPWDIKDSFLASALYLADYGAAKQTYDGEFNAALSYFAGPGWAKSSYASIYKRDYGYPVMAIVDRYESDIASIQ